uniref:Uncharacterized protein n=2 Tax=unclassified Caudoviricetes TaxID=2788787 RepID=A0A8S5MQT6_9CAUD|nr:MAG TPA: hypothetical protein [Siphoviridae sp. ctHSm42]DAD93139.1 MAG TPA: hypothetical protein [Siphoviridae sp. ctFxs15]
MTSNTTNISIKDTKIIYKNYFQGNFVDVNKTDSNALLSNNISEQTKKPQA